MSAKSLKLIVEPPHARWIAEHPEQGVEALSQAGIPTDRIAETLASEPHKLLDLATALLRAAQSSHASAGVVSAFEEAVVRIEYGLTKLNTHRYAFEVVRKLVGLDSESAFQVIEQAIRDAPDERSRSKTERMYVNLSKCVGRPLSPSLEIKPDSLSDCVACCALVCNLCAAGCLVCCGVACACCY